MHLKTQDPEKTQAQKQAEAIELIMGWDLSQVAERMVKREHGDPMLVQEMEAEYRKYMAIVISNPTEKVPIPREIDPFWHNHLLFTVDYCRFSELTAGRFIHHYPDVNAPEDEMRQLYVKHTLPSHMVLFGQPNRKFWPDPEQFVFCSCGCMEAPE